MKICFNGWFSGFFENTNPGLTFNFFMKLFENVYNEHIEIGNLIDSEILCEFVFVKKTFLFNKKWKHTYLFSGESKLNNNWEKYDCVLYGKNNQLNIINIPLFIPYLYTNNLIDELVNKKNIIYFPKKDVLCIISNPNGKERNQFLEKLEKKVNITYAGRYKNNFENIKFAYNTNEFNDFVKQFKFIISMENSKEETYITEKIIHGFRAGIIPIYWGSPEIYKYFNEKRFLNLDNNDDKLINQIIKLINNEEEWLKVVNQPVFKNNVLERDLNNISYDIKNLLKIK